MSSLNYLLAFGTSCLVALVIGPFAVNLLARLKVGQSVRDDGPESHLKKIGTPTMGGILFILSTAIATIIFALPKLEVFLAISIFIFFGIIGFADDYRKVILKQSLGLKARYKLLFQLLFSILLVVLILMFLDRGTAIIIPISGQEINLHWFFILFAGLVIVGASNAVNITDGLDGLAGGVSLIAVLVYAVIAFINGHYEIAVFLSALAGGLLGFLFYNFNPAKIFMGDTGSLSIGAALAACAVITASELFLVVVGGVFVIETLSVIIQVLYFKKTGRRIFKMSPLHHHFELKGWPEKQVVYVFWLAALILGLIGLFLYFFT